MLLLKLLLLKLLLFGGRASADAIGISLGRLASSMSSNSLPMPMTQALNANSWLAPRLSLSEQHRFLAAAIVHLRRNNWQLAGEGWTLSGVSFM